MLRDTDSGVRDDHVQSAQFIDGSVDRFPKLVEMPNVGGRGNHAAAEGADLTFRFVKVFWGGRVVRHVIGKRSSEINGDDVRAFVGQPDRMHAPLPSRRAGDQSHPSL